MEIAVHNFRTNVNVLIYTGWGGGGGLFSVSGRQKYKWKATFNAAECA